MINIDRSLIEELGLAELPDEVANDLLRHIYETLEMRVGKQLADQMNDRQLDEFEAFFEDKDDAGAFEWLESIFPNYKEIVAGQFAALKVEIAANSEAILASA